MKTPSAGGSAAHDTLRPIDHPLHRLFLDDVPLMDVRAPIEFAKGAFPGTVNLPLMDDAEREQVGTLYKQQGQQAAIERGHQLVSGTIREARIAAWAAFARAHPHGMLYCARGGLRSQIVQQWMASDADVAYPRVPGGFKAMRGFLIELIEQAASRDAFMVLSGLTGCGKTEVLQTQPNSLDLEGHAHHRGSSFGNHLDGQPPQIAFEHSLAIDLLKKRHAGIRTWLLEDEGHHIGACAIPVPLRQRMAQAPILWLEEPFDRRVSRILRDYVTGLHTQCEQRWGPIDGLTQFEARLRHSLDRIQTRLGGERHARLRARMDGALQATSPEQAQALHRDWISTLLREYYDPMYRFQRQAKSTQIVMTGDRQAVLDYLAAYTPPTV